MKGYIYFLRIKDTPLVKIGRSVNPKVRVAQFCIPYEAEIIKILHSDDCHTTEKAFHVLFKTGRVRGEWFKLSDADIDLIQRMREELVPSIHSISGVGR